MPVIFRYFWITILLFLVLSPARTAHAHGDEPRLELSLERINPGGVIDVRGVDFEREELITLALIGEGVEFPFGEIAADAEGIFLQIVTVPIELMEGEYRFRAVTDDHEVLSPVVTVFGAALSEGEGGEGLRDEDDPLLAPMPTFAPGVVPGGVSQPTPQQIAEEAPISNRNSSVPMVFVLLGVGILVLFGLRFIRQN